VEKFEKKLKWRIWVCRAMIVLQLIVMVMIGETDGLLDSRTMSRKEQDVSRLIFFGTLIWLIVCIARTKRLLSRRLDRRERQILEEDERRMAIRQKSGAWAMDVLMAMLLAAVFVLAYVDMAAFYAAYTILLTAAALRGAAAWYYSKRL